MKTTWYVQTPVETELLTSAIAKLEARIDATAEDSLIDIYITAARQHVENVTGRAIGSQTWEYQQEDWTDEFHLPGAPLTSVTHIKYYDTNGTEQTLSTSIYRVDTTSEPGRIELIDGQSWPALQAGRALPITVRYVLGYTSATLPKPLHTAMLAAMRHFYTREGQWADVKAAIDFLCGPYMAPWREPKAA